MELSKRSTFPTCLAKEASVPDWADEFGLYKGSPKFECMDKNLRELLFPEDCPEGQSLIPDAQSTVPFAVILDDTVEEGKFRLKYRLNVDKGFKLFDVITGAMWDYEHNFNMDVNKFMAYVESAAKDDGMSSLDEGHYAFYVFCKVFGDKINQVLDRENDWGFVNHARECMILRIGDGFYVGCGRMFRTWQGALIGSRYEGYKLDWVCFDNNYEIKGDWKMLLTFFERSHLFWPLIRDVTLVVRPRVEES